MKHKRLLVRPGHRVRFKDIDPGQTCGYRQEESAGGKLQSDIDRLSELQEKLWASQTYALLIILQGMDTAGKDGIIKHVTTGLNSQGVDVHAFRQPSAEELEHDFLWRCIKVLPERGRIGIFNRSYYEEVLVARVNPQVLKHEHLPSPDARKDVWSRRFREICDFEDYLVRNGTVVLKFFLHISKKEQARRLLDRVERPDKHWKLSATDVPTHLAWKKYQKAYEAMLSATSSKRAPWYIIPSDHKWVARVLVADIIVRSLKAMKLRYPHPSVSKTQMKEAERLLRSEL